MKKTIQITTQVIFLAIFILLIINNRVQLWMGLFILSVIATLLLGRVYCGWICPINTVMRSVTWIKKKLHIKSYNIPSFFKKPWLRYVLLGLFIGVFIFTLITGKKLPILPIVLVIGVLFTFFFPEELWHRCLCPFGTILSLPGRKSMHALKIDQDKCISCGICKKVCPAKAVNKDEKVYTIIKKDCLLCMDCSIQCPQQAIPYQKAR